MIGNWLTMDFDWNNHHVIYHGWNRPGWVNHARPYIHLNNVYAHTSRPDINKNWRHDNSHGNPDSFRTAHPGGAPGTSMKSRVAEIRGRSVKVAPPKISSSPDIKKQRVITIPDVSKRPGAQTIDITKRPEQPARSVSRETPQTRPAPEVFTPPKTPSVTFGGYRGAKEARGQSMRGQASRQSSERTGSFATPAAKSSTPERKGVSGGNAPAGKGDGGNKSRR